VLGKTYDSQVCSIARALEVVGERWSILILRNALFAGSTRYSEFQQSLGIATNVLSDRLDGFVAAGIMERRAAGEQTESFGYVLTDKGRDFAAALVALTQWGDRWAAPDGPPILYQHKGCGSAVSVVATCASCGPVNAGVEVEALPGPGMPAERAHRVRQRLANAGATRDPSAVAATHGG
jgi:DNA-binding HxlR family transcriptional regulator